MIVFESRLVRRFVGRLERGEEVVGTLRQLCEQERVRGGWIRAVGTLEWAELTEWDPVREGWRAPRRIEGPISAVSIEGTVAIRNGPPYVELHAALVRADELGFRGLGGVIAQARVHAIDFTIEGFEDVRLERDEDPATGLALFKGPSARGVLAREPREASRESERRPAPPAAPPRPAPTQPTPPRALEPVRTPEPMDEDDAEPQAPSGAVSWAQVAAVSASAPEAVPARTAATRPPVGGLLPDLGTRPAAPSSDEPVPQKGDYIDHRQFGLCRVDGEDEDGGLRIRLPSGVRKVIRLDIFEVMPPRHEGDRRVFPLRPRRR